MAATLKGVIDAAKVRDGEERTLEIVNAKEQGRKVEKHTKADRFTALTAAVLQVNVAGLRVLLESGAALRAPSRENSRGGGGDDDDGMVADFGVFPLHLAFLSGGSVDIKLRVEALGVLLKAADDRMSRSELESFLACRLNHAQPLAPSPLSLSLSLRKCPSCLTLTLTLPYLPSPLASQQAGDMPSYGSLLHVALNESCLRTTKDFESLIALTREFVTFARAKMSRRVFRELVGRQKQPKGDSKHGLTAFNELCCTNKPINAEQVQL